MKSSPHALSPLFHASRHLASPTSFDSLVTNVAGVYPYQKLIYNLESEKKKKKGERILPQETSIQPPLYPIYSPPPFLPPALDQPQ